MGLIFDYEEICHINKEFYDLFEPKNGIETDKFYNRKKELAKYVAHAKFSHDVAYNNCELTFKEWCKKYKLISSKEI